jgi:predicted nucleic acid-binding protein
VFSRAATGLLSIVTSELALAEVLVMPMRTGNAALVNHYIEAVSSREYLDVVPVNRDIIIGSARLRSASAVRLPDAIHVATALAAGCSVFLSEDKRIPSPPGLQLLKISDLKRA